MTNRIAQHATDAHTHTMFTPPTRLRNFLLGLVLPLLAYALSVLRRTKRTRALLESRFPEGPRTSFLLGNIPELMREGGFGERFFESLHIEHGSFARFFIGPLNLNLSLTDPKDVSDLYARAPDRPKETEMFLPYLGEDSLMFQHGPFVKALRSKYAKLSTSPEQLRVAHKLCVENTVSWTRNWHRGAVELHSELASLLYDVMGEILFRKRWSEHGLGEQIREKHLYLIKWAGHWAFFPIKPMWNADYHMFLKTIERLRELCGQAIETRRGEIESNPKLFENDTSALTILVSERTEDGSELFFSPHLAVSTIIGLLNGAFDTTHATLYWVFFNLAKHQDAQTELLKEIDSRIGRKMAPSIDELRDMPYLDAVLKESMRVRCTVPINQRNNVSEEFIVAGRVVPKAVNVNVAMILIMKSPKYFSNPDVFSPERFLGESESAVKQRENWMAFGQHSRMCVGMNLALTELRAIVCTLLQRYSIALEDLNEMGEYMVEAGVTQPAKPARFVFALKKVQTAM